MQLDPKNIDPLLISAIAQAVAREVAAILAPTVPAAASPTSWLGIGKAAAALGISDYKLRQQHSRLRLGKEYRPTKGGRGQFEYHVENCRDRISG